MTEISKEEGAVEIHPLEEGQEVQESLLEGQLVKIVKLSINNFLSFDYEEVCLSPQFTIAYGPNGAGKSTIYQALKFVLGSNDYDGRYCKWSNFIRSGENAAYVVVNIAKGKMRYKIKRSVRRKKSPIFFFQTPQDEELKAVRSTKVKDFLDSIDINPDNIFSFMSQGNIDNIKDFDEKTICKFIEKGIGLESLRDQIIGQKRKIEELEREENALESRKNHLQDELVLLKPKLRKLEKKIQLQKQLDQLETELIWAKKEEIEKQIEEYQIRINSYQEQIDVIQTQLDEMKEKNREIEQKRENLDKKYGEIVEITSNKKAKKNSIQDKLKDFNQEKNSLADKIQEISSEIQDKNEKIKKHTIEHDKLEKTIENLNEKIAQVGSEVGKLENEQQKIIKKSQKHQKYLVDLETNKEKLKNSKERLEQSKKDHQSCEQEIEEKLAEIKKIKHDLGEYDWFMKNPTKGLVEKYKTQHKRYQEAIKTYARDLDELQVRYRKITEKLETTKKSVYDKDMPKPRSIRIMMKTIKERGMENQVYGPLIDYISFDDIFQMAVKSIFGYRVLFSFVAANNEAFHRLKRIAQDSRAKVNIYMGRNKKMQKPTPMKNAGHGGVFGYLANKIRIPHQIPGIEKVVLNRAKRTLVVKDHIVGTNYIQKYNYTNWVVTLDGEQIRPNKYLLEARPYIKDKSTVKFSSVSETKQYIKKLEEKAEKNRNAYNQRKQQKSKIESKFGIIDGRINKIDVLWGKFKKMEILTKTKNAKMAKRKSIFEQITQTEKKIDNISQFMNKIRKNIPENIYEQQKRLEEIPEQLSNLKKDLEEYQKSRTNVLEQKTNVNNILVTLKAEIGVKSKQIDELNEKLRKMDGNYFKLIQKSMDLTEEIEELKKEKQKIKEDLDKIKNVLKEENKLQQQLELKKIQDTGKIEKLQSFVDENNEKLEILKQQVKTEEKGSRKKARAIVEIERDILHVEKNLENYRDVNRSLFGKKEDLEQRITIISSKEEQIVEEIQAAFEAEKGLEKNYFDKYSKSITQLEGQINEKFQSAEIGFSANIMLHGGIEDLGITVNTTFKNENGESITRNLTALSGGQRSMVGICLMLSLHQLKPSPFNIYDEIEMFLDPSNAQTVARLIHQLTQNGLQFVLLMPDKSKTLIQLADKVIGVCKNGKHGCSMLLNCEPNVC